MADEVNYPYGKLNPTVPKKFGKNIEVNSTNTLNQLKNVLADQYIEKVDDSGEFVGIVLRQEKSPENGFFSSVYDSVSGIFGKEEDLQFISYRVRVPEIDSLIPEPKDFENDLISINLHTIFSTPSGNSDIDSLAPGSLVVVSYKDGQGRDRPTLVRKWLGVAPVPNKKSNPSDSHGPSGPGNVGVGTNYGPQPPDVNNPRPPSRVIDHNGKTEVIISACMFKENRVAANEALTELPGNSPILVNVATPNKVAQQKLHSLVAKRFESLREAAKREIGADIMVKSGWRKMRWKTRQDYDKFIKESYVNNPDSSFFYRNFMTGNTSESQARANAAKGAEGDQAFISGHMTGMAVDFYIEPVKYGDVLISPSSMGNYVMEVDNKKIRVLDRSKYGGQSKSYQRRSTAYIWLTRNARRFGFTPLNREPWHWECLLPIESWKTGVDYTDRYDVQISERSIKTRTYTSNRNFRYE